MDPANRLAYFEELARKGRVRTAFNRYYWKDITKQCAYFSHPDRSVLEIGCGTGELLAGISGSRKVGVDFSPSMIELARKADPDIEFHVMPAEQITLTEKFDLVIVSNLVGFTNDVQRVFEELRKVCHERTKVIVTYYNSLWAPLLRLGERLGLKSRVPEQNWLTMSDLNNLLMLAGFDVYRNTRRMLLPVYIPLLSPLLNRYIAKLPLFRALCINYYSFAMPRNTASEIEAASKYSTTVVIPARNESGNIEQAITRMPRFGKHTEIIFVEGNSTDDTWQKVQEVAEKYKHSHTIRIAQQPGKGKNDAVKTGYAMATGDILMILDADLTVPPEDLPKFYNAIATGKGDFINGSRLVYPMEKEAMRSLNLLGNRFFSWMFTWLLEQRFKDTLCGTKVIFRDDYYRLVKNRSYFGDFDPFGDFDLIFGAHKLNLRITELPIRYAERTYGSTNISRFKHGLILLRMCAFAARKIKFV
jgi:ubiquinone/menaquinone biosynthesis C-methylase UbiE